MARLILILAFAALSAPALAEPVCVWGKPADLIARMESGRPGYDALMVEFEAGKPVFVLLRRGETLPASCN